MMKFCKICFYSKIKGNGPKFKWHCMCFMFKCYYKNIYHLISKQKVNEGYLWLYSTKENASANCKFNNLSIHLLGWWKIMCLIITHILKLTSEMLCLSLEKWRCKTTHKLTLKFSWMVCSTIVHAVNNDKNQWKHYHAVGA